MADIDLMSAEELFQYSKTHGKFVFSKKNPVFTLCIYKIKTGFSEIISDSKNGELMSAVVHDISSMQQHYGRLF